MIIDPMIGTVAERQRAVARQKLAASARHVRIVASSAFGKYVPAMLRKMIGGLDAFSDDELMHYAVAGGALWGGSGLFATFGALGGERGACHPDDLLAIADGHSPIGVAVGPKVTGRVRFCAPGTPALAGWTDITSVALGGPYAIAGTRREVAVTDAFAGIANDGGYFPDAAQSFYIDGGNAGAVLAIYGLAPSREHKIRVMSSTTAGASTGYFQLRNAVTKTGFNGRGSWEAFTVNAYNNASVVEFTVPVLLQPVPVELVVTIQSGTRAYLNAIEIETPET